MRSEGRVAVAFRRESSFVTTDISILAKHFSVVPLQWKHGSGPLQLARIAPRVDAIYSWFAGPYAALATYLAKPFRLKTMVMLGGYDCARFLVEGYGAFTNPVLSSFVRTAVRRSDVVAAVDPGLVRELEGNMHVGRDILVMPTGYDHAFFSPSGVKRGIVLTVGAIDKSTAYRKGFYTFAKVAARLTSLAFVVVGRVIDPEVASQLVSMSRGRIQLTGYLSQNELLEYYRAAKVYCQLSLHEGLPNALCEAMLCECVPVGTSNGGIPRAMGSTGALCAFNDIDGTVDAIEKALRLDGSAARDYIKDSFPLSLREKRLVDTLTGML